MSERDNLDKVLHDMQLPYTLTKIQYEDTLDCIQSERFGLFNGVGCGKTVCTTAAALVWNNEFNVVTMPPILLPQWARWLKKVGQNDVSIYAGPKRTEDMLNHRWVLMSHAIFRDSFNTIRDFYKGKRAALLVDEAQALKNPESKLFRYSRMFVEPDRNCVMMTGTPTSKPEDTYAYMKIKTPQQYRSFGHWENLHVGSRNIFKQITSYCNLEMLAEAFALNSVKRTKKEIFGSNLDPIWQEKPYNLSPAHLKLYNRLAEEQLLLLPDGGKIDATTAQKLRHALQQIVVNYAAFSGNPDDRSATYDLIDEAIEEVEPMNVNNTKLIIWTYYKQTSRNLTAYLKAKFGEQAVVAAYSETDSAKAVDRIMFDDTARLGVFQPTSVGAGLELQYVCHTMLFAEQSTVPMHTRQAAGRVDRPGQTVRPTLWFGQAQGSIQVALFNVMMKNDDLVSVVERNKTTLRDEIFGRV